MHRRYKKSLKISVLFFTVVIFCLGVANFLAKATYPVLTDGAHWVYSGGRLVTEMVDTGSAADRAGIEQGDVLGAINFHHVEFPEDVAKVLQSNAASQKPLQYEISRQNESFIKLIIPHRKSNSFYYYLASIGFIILGIGLLAFLRSRNHPFALHFYLLCLALYGTYVFSFTGKLDPLDWIFFWADEVFLLSLAPLFLHFALYFPGKRSSVSRERLVLLYLPSLLLLIARVSFTLFYFVWR
ncbi:MAG TPA: PDZ domain-containing protein, partial [Acidobacteriota bacterium]|nr:PDZ domain-containing protein [Acidobacteriota bacterium]